MKTNKIISVSDSHLEVNIEKVFSKELTVGLLMFFSGVLLLLLVGFAQFPGNFIHNAAHDTRHVTGFPCH